MAMIINSNVASLNAQRNLTSSQSDLNVSLQRLSTGLRINSAKDDAAGLAISERFSTQIRGLNQAARNANDGISLAQTAEGALGGVTDLLQRVRELSVQSANATNNASDRAALQSEVTQLVEEVNRVAQTTSFNGVALLDGSFTAQAFQVGANANQTVSIASIANAQTSVLGQYDSFASSSSSTGGVTAGVAAQGELTINGVDVFNSNGGAVARDAVALATAISGTSTDITATATASTSGDLAFTSLTGGATASVTSAAVGSAIDGSNALVVNGTSVTATAQDAVLIATQISTEVADVSATAQNTTAAVGNAAFVNITAGAGAYSLTVDAVTLFADADTSDGTGVVVGDVAAGIFANTAAITGAGYAFADNGTAITSAAEIEAALTAGTFEVTRADGANVVVAESKGGLTGGLTSDATDYTATGYGEVVITSTSSEGLSFTGSTGTFAGDGSLVTTAAQGDTFSLTVGGVSIVSSQVLGTNGFAQADLNAAVAQASTALEAAGITYAHGTFSDAQGDNLAVALSFTEDGVYGVGTTIQGGFTGGGFAADAASTQTYYGGLSISSTAGDGIVLGGTTGAALAAGLADQTAVSTSATVADVDISTAAGAQTAINIIDQALTEINSSRADLGALQNRFEAVVSNISITSENLSAARSRIMDADFAAETASLTRAQILQQAGVSILAQANSLPQLALSLLQ